MWIFLTHRLTLHSHEQKENFLRRLSDHAESSKSLNYFTATIQDYGITVKSNNKRILVRDKFGRRNFFLAITVSEATKGCIIHATVKPTLGNIIVNIILTLFVLICPFPMELKYVFIGLIFIFELIALAFNVWWAKDLFAKKLLTNNSSVKDRNL